MAQQKLPKAGWFLPLSSINDIQAESVAAQIVRTKQAHSTDLDIRINGKNELHQADWVKKLQPVDVSPPEPRRIYHLEVGDKDNVPTAEELHSVMQSFLDAHKAGDGSTVATHFACKMTEFVIPNGADAIFTEPVDRFKPHEVRVVYELRDLEVRIGKLEKFIQADNPVFRALPLYEQDLLEEQLKVMSRLAVILRRRIDLFEPSEE